MKKLAKTIFSTLLISCLLFNPALAATVETQDLTEAGITPDSILYNFDLLFEDLQLALSSNPESDADLLLAFAKERLSEAKEMTIEEKNEFVQLAMNDYLLTYQEAQALITEIIIEETVDPDTLENLLTGLEEVSVIDGAIEENLESEDSALIEKIDNAYLVANVVKDLNQEQVIALRESDMGYGQIAQVFALAQYTGKSVEEIGLLFTGEDVGFGEVAKQLEISPSEFNKETKSNQNKNVEVITDEPEQVEALVADENLTVESSDVNNTVKEIKNQGKQNSNKKK